MKSLVLALSLVSSFAMAETAKISIEGMHCSGCKEMITKKVCDDAAIKKTAESCDVKVTDADKKTGEIVITTKGDEKVDVDAVKRQLAATGEGYKVANVEVKNVVKKNADGTPMTAEQEAAVTAAAETKVPGTKTVTTTTTIETETVGADGKVEVKKEVTVKKKKTASKTTTTTDKKANK